MTSCPNCRQEPEPDANFCYHCGERLPSEPIPEPVPSYFENQEPKRRRWPLVLAAAVALIALGFIGWQMVLRETTPAPELATEPTTLALPDQTNPTVVPSVPPQVVASTRGTTRLTISTFNCDSCEITAIPADGSAPQVATVAAGTAKFALPTAQTLGLAFTVKHPDGFGANSAPNVLILRPGGVAPGEEATVTDVIRSVGSAVCWSGTDQETATLDLVADTYLADEVAQLRVWTNPAQQTLSVVTAPNPDGSIGEAGLADCKAAAAQALSN